MNAKITDTEITGDLNTQYELTVLSGLNKQSCITGTLMRNSRTDGRRRKNEREDTVKNRRTVVIGKNEDKGRLKRCAVTKILFSFFTLLAYTKKLPVLPSKRFQPSLPWSGHRSMSYCPKRLYSHICSVSFEYDVL